MTTDFAFLHGGGQGSWVWQEAIAALTRQAGDALGRVLALDVPGCGTKRSRDTSTLTIDAVADELMRDIVAAGLRDVVLVGHSQAGSVLPMLAARMPGMFRRLVYVACSSPLPGQTVVQMMGSGLHGSHPDEIGWPVDPRTHTSEQRYPLMFCNDMSATETAAFLAKLGQDSWPAHSYAATDWRYDHLDAVPASYVLCLRDGILPVVWQEELARRFRTCRTVRVDGGHQVVNTRPHTLAEVLRIEAR